MTYIPQGTAITVLNSNVRESVVSGPAGTGKSRACLEKANALAERYPGMRGLILRKTRESLSEAGLFTFESFVLGPSHPIMRRSPRRNYRQIYKYLNGSEIVVGGMDKASKVLSSEYDYIYVQQAEELTEEDWEILTTRLRHGIVPYQQIMACCNPDKPTHWLKARCDEGRTQYIASLHEDNPVLYDIAQGEWTDQGEVYIETLQALTGVRRLRLYKGLWVQAEGIIYDTYDPIVHLIDKFVPPVEWTRVCSVDFGFVHPFVCQFWALDEDKRAYRYKEIYQTKRTVVSHAKTIRKVLAEEGLEPKDVSEWVCDHAAGDRALLEEELGIETIAASKGISIGIQVMQERLKVQADGRPRLFYVRDALYETDQLLRAERRPLCSEQEIDGYVWSNHKTKERPVDRDDHGMDSTRYAMMYFDQGGKALEVGYNPLVGFRG